MPRVTVVVPAHEAESYVAQTLESVVAQTFGDWEAVVVDDASHDATAARARSVADPRITVVRSERNLGPAGARNLALEHAGGELVALLDADDRWLPAYLERQVALYDAEESRAPGVGIVACDAWVEGPEGRRPQTYGETFGRPEGADLTSLLRANTIFVSALAPRRVVEEAGGFSTECFGSEDHDLWLRIVEAGYRVVATREPLAVYRVSGGGLSSDALGMARTTEATYRRALARGRLDRRQRRIARRHLRVARSAAAVEVLAADWRQRRRFPWRRALRAAPLLAGTALSRPDRWRHWLRALAPRRTPAR